MSLFRYVVWLRNVGECVCQMAYDGSYQFLIKARSFLVMVMPWVFLQQPLVSFFCLGTLLTRFLKEIPKGKVSSILYFFLLSSAVFAEFSQEGPGLCE